MATKSVSSSQQQLPWCVKWHEEAIEGIRVAIIPYVCHVGLITVAVTITVLIVARETFRRLALVCVAILVALRALGTDVLRTLVAGTVLSAVSQTKAYVSLAVLAAHALQGMTWPSSCIWGFLGNAVALL